jgi:type IV pilus assembly protein PilY1
MVSKGLEKIVRTLLVVATAALLQSGGVIADDTEIYQSTPSSTNTRPQVLIIFDDSGSMSEVIAGQRPPYDPNASYTETFPRGRVYWSTEPLVTGVPLMASFNYFTTDSNRCDTSITPLLDNGFFQTRAVRWSSGSRGGDSSWTALSSSVRSPPHVECEADVINRNPANPGSPFIGYPQDTSNNGEEYGPDPDNTPEWGSKAYTFYSAHYLDWYYDPDSGVNRTRLDIAQAVVDSLVSANTAIDFGLALFNSNDINYTLDPNDPSYDPFPHHGGRIVQRLIPDMEETQRTNLTALVNDTNPDGFTPLCETTMEVYRYLAGQGVVYGSQRNTNPLDSNDPASPLRDPIPKDPEAESESPSGTYDSQLTDCAYTYVILMTDGRPTYDQDANDAIESLTGKTCQEYDIDPAISTDPVTGEPVYGKSKNCLPEIVEYMANTDLDGNSSNGDQFGITYTIGFATDQQLLRDTADKGNGQYFTADDADQLTAAFQGAILDILSTDTTFTSPAVAVDTFTRTQSRNEVFFAMFKPDSRVDWPGNVKRLNIDFSSGDAVLVDDNGLAAIETSSGQIKSTATTVWSMVEDGPTVLEGGVGALLAARDPADRNIYSNTGLGLNESLEDYGATNMTAAAFGYDNNDELYRLGFGVDTQTEFLAALDWGAGYDVSDEDGDGITNEARSWILGDILHSKPLVVNYGARTSSFSVDEPDLRIVVGTNAGFLHMFDNRDGQENWAFFAKELGPLLNTRRVNAVSAQHPYGIDAPVVLYTRDVNKDGTIDWNDGDKAYIYFGLRRGGRILYAMDISNPDDPDLLWRKDNTSPGFAELGQTWSVPVVTKIPGYAKPVLIFGAGYDPIKDGSGVASPDTDTMGRGIFIVDAATGDLIWSLTPADNSATNMKESGLEHSVAASVTVLDSNGDGQTDRVYFADTGGNVWRVDLSGNALPSASQDSWYVVKLIDVNGGTPATDRRFFNAPDVVRTAYAGAAFDAILIGSGDRTNPNDMDNPSDLNDPAVDNQFYMLRDKATNPYFTSAPSSCAPTDVDFRCQLPLDPNDIYDVTPNDIESTDPAVRSAAQLALSNSNGWKLDLEADGEKALSSSITINGKVFFTTFSPNSASSAANVCVPELGTGRLYVVDLYNASPEEDFDSNGNTERSWIIGAILPDTPSPHFGEDGVIRLLLPPGSGGGGEVISPFLTGGSVPQPRGTYWFREEY